MMKTLFSGKKGIQLTASKLIIVLLGAAVMVIGLYIIFGPIMKAHSQFDFGMTKCTASEKDRTPEDFFQTIRRYGGKEREGGVPNELYSPEDALRHFQIFLTCKEDGVFSPAELSSTVEGGQGPNISASIDYVARAVYVNYAEDLCADWCRACSAGAESEAKDLKEKHYSLSDDYHETFRTGAMTTPSLTRCSDSQQFCSSTQGCDASSTVA